MRLYLDIETRSISNLTRVGTHPYSEDPSTQIIGFSYAFGERELPVWILTGPKPVVPQSIQDHIAAGGEVWAHNAEFERLIWNATMPGPGIRISQTRCTMAMARSMGLPASLGQAAAAAGIVSRKDYAGYRLMMKMCEPRETVTGKCPDCGPKKRGGRCRRCGGTGQVVFAWHEDPADVARLGDYCIQDVNVLRELARRLLPLTDRELQIYHVDQAVNDRGVLIDVELAKKAETIRSAEVIRLDNEIDTLTRHKVKTGNCHVALARWLQDWGLPAHGVAQEDVTALLARDDIPPLCRKVLQARHDIGKSSLAKIPAFIEMVSRDQRLKANLNYYGAGQTGRWTGKGVQLHNLPRPELGPELIAAAIKLLEDSSPEEWMKLTGIYYGNPLNVLADCLRGLLIPDPAFRGVRPVLTIHDEIVLEADGQFVVLDYAQVEARGLAFLAGHREDLAVFAANGPIYELRASRIWGRPPESFAKGSKERHIAKETVLGCGYGMGHKKFKDYLGAKGLYVSSPDAQRIVHGWREDHKEVTSWWTELKDAAFSAVENPNVAQHVRGGVEFQVSGSFLFCRIPSGRQICYPFPRLEERKAPWGENVRALTYMVWRQKKWVRDSTFGGKLAENIVQGFCRDLLADALVRFELECPAGFLRSKESFEEFMCRAPKWADGMPIKVEGFTCQRYRK